MTATLMNALKPWPLSASNVRALIEENGYEVVVFYGTGNTVTVKAVHPERPTITQAGQEYSGAFIAAANEMLESAGEDDCPDYHPGCEDCFCCPDGCNSDRCPRNSVGDSICPCTCP